MLIRGFISPRIIPAIIVVALAVALMADNAIAQSPTGGTPASDAPRQNNVSLFFGQQYPDGDFAFTASGIVNGSWGECGYSVTCPKYGRIKVVTDRKGRSRVVIKLARGEQLVGVSFAYSTPNADSLSDSTALHRVMWDDGMTKPKRSFKLGKTIVDDGEPVWTELAFVNAMIYSPRFSSPPPPCDDVSCPETMAPVGSPK